MRLFRFSYSPFAVKVEKVLELKGLEYEAVEVPYLDRRALVALGAGVHVPVLEHEGEVIRDSARITAWLDARFAPSLRTDPLAVVVEQWAESALEDAAFRLACPGIEARLAALNGGRADAPAMFRLVKERRYGAGCIDAWHAERGALADRVAELVDPLGRALAARPFLLGDRPSLADAAVYGQLHMVQFAIPGFVAERLPALADWYARLRAARAEP